MILLGYLEWGEHCVERLSGMFAFAIWDAREKRLVLARDRVGKKPLYYGALEFLIRIRVGTQGAQGRWFVPERGGC